ncbi:MAG: hypothetical protein ABSD53_15090 [Terriglobales bacterium]
MIECLFAAMQRAVHVRVFEFLGQKAGDRGRIFTIKSGSPGLFLRDQSGLSLRLILETIGGEGGKTESQHGSKQRCDFHVCIVP